MFSRNLYYSSSLFLAINSNIKRFLLQIMKFNITKADKCVVIYGRSTNLSGPVRMALRGLLIALLGKPQRRFCAIEYIRAVKRSTVPVAVVRSAMQREFGGSRSLRCSLSLVDSAASQMRAIRSKAGLLRCTRNNASVRRAKNT